MKQDEINVGVLVRLWKRDWPLTSDLTVKVK